MRFSEYVKHSKTRRSLHEDELKDSSYYVDSNGFVTSKIADKIKSKEYLTEGDSQIDFSKVRLNNLEDLFRAVDFVFKGDKILYYYKNIAEFAADWSGVYGITEMLEIAISSSAHSPKLTTEPLIFSKRSKKIYGIYSGKVDGNRLKKLSSDLDVEVKNSLLANDFLK